MGIKRALANDIRIGGNAAPLYRFRNASVELNSLKATVGVDVVGDKLTIDTFSFTVRHRFDAPEIYAPRTVQNGKFTSGYRDTDGRIYRTRTSGIEQYVKFIPDGADALVDANGAIFQTFAGYAAEDYMDLPFGTPVWWYVAGELFLKGYVKGKTRGKRYAWTVNCVSGVGLLDAKMHDGGIYSGVTVATIAQSIIGSSFPYTIDSEVANVPIYGHLPYDTARENLHKLLFAVGASLVKGAGGLDYNVRFLGTSEVDVPDNRIAMKGSIDTKLPATGVEVVEHNFQKLSSDQSQVLFDNTDATASASSTFVKFDKPMYDLQTSGTLVIDRQSVNYAVVSGIGVLTGKPYTHTERLIALGGASSGETNVKRVNSNNHLISFANSINVAQRVLDYYSSARTLKANLKLEGEKPGMMLLIRDAFGEIKNAFLAKMNVAITSVRAAQCELIEGYTPRYSGNNYDQRLVVTRTGTYSITSALQRVRVVVIGGAQGGAGGYDGMDGSKAVTTSGSEEGDLQYELTGEYGDSERTEGYFYADGNQRKSKGGDAGLPGASGYVYSVDIVLPSPNAQISVEIGRGGLGGARNGEAGSLGTHTIVRIGNTVISSEQGLVSAYTDPETGEQYGGVGDTGHAGGDGGQVNDIHNLGWKPGNGLPGGSVGSYRGGAGSKPYKYEQWNIAAEPDELRNWTWGSGAGGGGAAWGANGSPASDARAYVDPDNGTVYPNITVTGKGGKGADAVAPSQPTVRGKGGQGGNGGGGGGNMGGGQSFNYVQAWMVNIPQGERAPGGKGSVGGQGADGIALFYFS